MNTLNETAATDAAGYAPADHPGIPVPAEMKSWATPWPQYAPVDITPPELRPEGWASSVAAGWAELWQTPADVPNWPERLACAVLPFTLDDQGRPLNPTGRTGRGGRNLGAWGENNAADAAVFAGTGRNRRVLLVKRSDNGAWAFPGGMREPGETLADTMPRELGEETGVDLAYLDPAILGHFYVADWRNTDHAWVVTTLGFYLLLDPEPAAGADDAEEAAWWPAPDLDTLVDALAPVGGLYEAHRPLVSAALEHCAKVEPAAPGPLPEVFRLFYASDDPLNNGSHLGDGVVWAGGAVTIRWRETPGNPAGETRFDSVAQARAATWRGGTRFQFLGRATGPQPSDGTA